jgi:rubredoxin
MYGETIFKKAKPLRTTPTCDIPEKKFTKIKKSLKYTDD